MSPKLGKGACVAINLEDFADGNVTHRTCIYANEYFDSFGLPPLDIIEDQLRKFIQITNGYQRIVWILLCLLYQRTC